VEEFEEFEEAEKFRKFDPLDGVAVRQQAGSNGIILWEGESKFVPGQDVVAILTFGSGNAKTGDIHQVWILVSDISPQKACQTGADRAVCGDCESRPGAVPKGEKRKQPKCYVQAWEGPRGVYESYVKGNYPYYSDDPEFYDKILKGGIIRWGAYGEPVLIPLEIVDHLSGPPVSVAWTGYTHAWNKDFGNEYKDYFMASVNSEDQYYDAVAEGWRTFRVRGFEEDLLPGENICPGSVEFELGKGLQVQCKDCLVCGGLGGRGQGNIAVFTHGSTKRGIPAADVPRAMKQTPKKWEPDTWDLSREALQKLDDARGGGLLQSPEQRTKFMRPSLEEPESRIGQRLIKLREKLVGARRKYAKSYEQYEKLQQQIIQAGLDGDDELEANLTAQADKIPLDRLKRTLERVTQHTEETAALSRERLMQRESMKTTLSPHQVSQVLMEADHRRPASSGRTTL
jgi:hypothetical protein